MRTLLAVVLLCAAMHAQTITGSIAGAIHHPSGLPISGVRLRLTHTPTGAQREASTDARGAFFFSTLSPGNYELTAQREGFKTLQRKDIALPASERLFLSELTLEIGRVNESITVEAEVAPLQVSTAERSGVITTAQVENLLIRGRNVMSMLQLLPGVVDVNDGTDDSMIADWNLRVNGARRTTNGVWLDGVNLTGTQNNYAATVNVSVEAVAEVKVLLSNYQAEYGRMSGANVQLVSKSGTKEFHGMGAYFKRHEQFNANNFFNNSLKQPKPRYRFNTISYNVGGPVFIPGRFNRDKDKLFFFWSQEYWPMKVSRALAQRTVPTAAERGGDFSQSLDLNNRLITVVDPLTRAPFPGNVIPANRIEPNGQALLKLLPLPNFTDRSTSGGRYNYVFQGDAENPVLAETLKTDWNINSRNMLAVNYSHRDYTQRDLFDSNWPQMLKEKANNGRVFVARYVRIFSPALISETNAGFTYRQWDDIIPNEELARNDRTAAGFRMPQLYPAANVLNLVPNATFGGVTNAANLRLDGRYPNQHRDKIFSLAESLTLTSGAHTLKGGVYIESQWTRTVWPVTFNGAFDFSRNASNPLDSGYAYSNAILGVFSTYTESSARAGFPVRTKNVEWYLQDNWKVTRRLTFDYGMRFCWVPPAFNPSGNVSAFAPDRWASASAARLIQPALAGTRRVGVDPVAKTEFQPALIGAIVPGAGDGANGMVVAKDDPRYPAALMDSRGIHLAPRFGFALDPIGKGKTVVRGGFGMFYNRERTDLTVSTYSAQMPIVNTPTLYYGAMSDIPTLPRITFPQDVYGLDRQGLVPTTTNFSLGVQHALPGQTLADVSYVGSLGRHLMWLRNLNPVPLGANFLPQNADPTNRTVPLLPNFLRPYQGYQNILMREWASSSNYHSLQASVMRRASTTLQYGASWTWSKAMTYADQDAEEVSTLVPVNVWNYGLSGDDRTLVFKGNWVWDLPRLKSMVSPVRAVLGGWQATGIVSFVSGAPMGVNVSTATTYDITGTPSLSPRTVVTGDPRLPNSERTFSRNFRTEVFQMPARGTYGNAAKYVLRGPGINRWDMSLLKNFRFHERARFQIRWELYNAFNHTQFSNMDVGARFDPQTGQQINSRFGEYTAARNPRQMQFAARLYF